MIKKSLSLFPFLLFTPCLKAALMVQIEGKNDYYTQEAQHNKDISTVYDYTLKVGVHVSHVMDDEDDINDMRGVLEGDLFMIESKLKDKDNPLLGAVLQHNQNGQYYRYLFFGEVPSTEEKATQKAHNQKFAYHIIGGEGSPHLMLQLISWLETKKEYSVKELYSNRAVCKSCHLMGNELFHDLIRESQNQITCQKFYKRVWLINCVKKTNLT